MDCLGLPCVDEERRGERKGSYSEYPLARLMFWSAVRRAVSGFVFEVEARGSSRRSFYTPARYPMTRAMVGI